MKKSLFFKPAQTELRILKVEERAWLPREEVPAPIFPLVPFAGLVRLRRLESRRDRKRKSRGKGLPLGSAHGDGSSGSDGHTEGPRFVHEDINK
jgi:hypothetical protein